VEIKSLVTNQFDNTLVNGSATNDKVEENLTIPDSSLIIKLIEDSQYKLSQKGNKGIDTFKAQIRINKSAFYDFLKLETLNRIKNIGGLQLAKEIFEFLNQVSYILQHKFYCYII
jgi:hypothetical protein